MIIELNSLIDWVAPSKFLPLILKGAPKSWFILALLQRSPMFLVATRSHSSSKVQFFCLFEPRTSSASTCTSLEAWATNALAETLVLRRFQFSPCFFFSCFFICKFGPFHFKRIRFRGSVCSDVWRYEIPWAAQAPDLELEMVAQLHQFPQFERVLDTYLVYLKPETNL